MRKVLRILLWAALLLSASHEAAAQHYLGAHGGWGAATARLYPKQEMKMVWGRWSAGVSWLHYGRTKYAGAIGAELLFIQRGYSYELYQATDTVFKRTLNSVMLPLMWHPHVNLFKNRLQIFINAGVTISYNFDSYTEERSGKDGLLRGGRYDMKLVRDNRWNYGLVGGFGIMARFEKWDVFFEGRYYIGDAEILKNRNKYKANPLRSPLDNLSFSLGFYRRLGRGGPPGPPKPRKGEVPSAVESVSEEATIIIE